MPGPERVADGPPQNEFRYFRPGNREEAERLAKVVSLAAVYTRGFEDKTRARHFEVWLAPPAK